MDMSTQYSYILLDYIYEHVVPILPNPVTSDV